MDSQTGKQTQANRLTNDDIRSFVTALRSEITMSQVNDLFRSPSPHHTRSSPLSPVAIIYHRKHQQSPPKFLTISYYLYTLRELARLVGTRLKETKKTSKEANWAEQK